MMKKNFNTEYYTGNDRYSDGEVEDVILEIVEKCTNLEDVLYSNENWAILYHLSNKRWNVLSWYPFDKNKTLLEIGSGCGALTGLFCERVKHVDCVELSKKRSKINYTRNNKYNNLKINVCSIMEYKNNKKYDYITLIGVLEYASAYVEKKFPFEELLKTTLSKLEDDGVLIIAIENKFGIKYWSGAKEDHTGQYFDGINNYIDNECVRTFSKHELTLLLNKSGYNKLEFYYPYPDYKFATSIFTDERLPTPNDLRNSKVNYDQDRVYLFDENEALTGLLNSGLFGEFSNSFIVTCRK